MVTEPEPPPAGAEAQAGPAGTWLTPGEALARRPITTTQAQPAQAETPLRYGFQAGAHGLLFEVGKSGEILEGPDICPVPNTAPWLVGLVNLRGNLVPVFDLSLLFARGAADTSWARLLVVGAGAEAVAFPVKELPTAIRLGTPLDRRPPMPEPIARHVRAAYLVDDDVWLDVDFDNFLLTLAAQVSV